MRSGGLSKVRYTKLDGWTYNMRIEEEKEEKKKVLLGEWEEGLKEFFGQDE